MTAPVTLTTRPVWRLRISQSLPVWLMRSAAVAGLIASLRFAVAPPKPPVPRARSTAPPVDLAAQSYAMLFARAYLTWEQNDPEARTRALESLGVSGLSPEAGSQAPTQGSEHVLFTQVVQERQPQPGLLVYSIAVQTDRQGLVYLTVPVSHDRDGSIELAGYPAFVGPPSTTQARALLTSGAEVQNAELRTVVTRALRNYLAPAPSDLAADLAPSAAVSEPAQGLTFEALQSLTWASGGGAVLAQVLAAGREGARYTLAYEIDVTRAAGRFELTAIQMDPRT
jgi:hypothetical protein